MKSKVKNSVLENKGKPLFKVLGLIVLLFSILIFIETRKEKEIDSFGMDNVGIVDYCQYVSYIDNAKSQKRISFYRIRVDYQFKGGNYSATIEMQPQEYNDMFGYKLNKGDEIAIKHSTQNPNYVRISETKK